MREVPPDAITTTRSADLADCGYAASLRLRVGLATGRDQRTSVYSNPFRSASDTVATIRVWPDGEIYDGIG